MSSPFTHPGSTLRSSNRVAAPRVCSALALAASLCLAASAQAAPLATPLATSVADSAALRQAATAARLPGLVRNFLKLRGKTPAEESAAEPETSRADPLVLALVLPEVLATVDQSLLTAPSAMFGALQAARSGFDAALKQLHGGGSDTSPQFMVGVLQRAADGQAGLDQALDIAAVVDPVQVGLLLPAVQKVREAASRTSQGLIDLAAAAGVSDARLSPARDALRHADALFLAGDYGGAGQQYAGGFGLAANTVVFNLDRFEQNLRSVFDSHTVGWAYAISQSGQLARSGSAGQARTGADLPATAQSSSKPMHVASVSKTMTAIVVLRLLADRGLSPDSAIGPWLPAQWARGQGVDSISFRQLMTHRSGFGQNAPGGSDFAKLQAMVALDVPFKGGFDYENANFGLLRVISSKLAGVDPYLIAGDPGSLSTAAFLTAAQTLYTPVGVPFSCEPQASKPTLQYDFPDTGNPGYPEPSRSLSCGGFGVQISARNLVRTLSYLRYTEDLMPAASYQAMKSGFLGFNDPAQYSFAQGQFGTYYTHGGDWDHTGSGGLDACVMVYPIHVEAALTINSSRKNLGQGYPNGGYQCTVLKWAFENAWVAN